MTVTAALVVAWALLGLIGPLLTLCVALIAIRRVPELGALNPKTPLEWPELSVLVPACNEAATIEAALSSLLREDYPAMEVVVVDDRSTDGTGAIIDRLAAGDPRVTAVHVTELPSGWLGKVHALARGLDRARGSWILFTDADVHFAPGTLRKAVAWAEQERFDHVCAFSEVRIPSPLVGAGVASSFRGVLILARPWRATDPKAKVAIGAGAFNLVRRSAFEKTPGLEWLRMEVADDIGLGLMMKLSGATVGLVSGRRTVIVEPYPTLRALVRGLEKNGFAQAARFRVWRGLSIAALGVLGALAPFAAFLPVGVPGLWIVGVVSLAIFAAACVPMARLTPMPIAWILLSLPFGDLIMAYVIARATILGALRGGLIWRGTVYPTPELEEGRRVDF